MNKFDTPQEEFWAGDFGTDYIGRNEGKDLLASNLRFFTSALRQALDIQSCLEFGANVGINLRALELLYPNIEFEGIEINPAAAEVLRSLIGKENVSEGSIFDYPITKKYDLTLIKTVLIHINPEKLNSVYEKIYEASNKYILIAEYYNQTPVTINYRGHDDRLFKRDFAGEMLDKYSDLAIVDYGFVYDRVDPLLDNITWTLLRK